MEYRHLKYILKIAEEKSISLAAQKLYISQPSLSQFLQKVEKNIGSPLFDRSTTPLHTTDIGELYINTAKQILDLSEQFRQQTDDLLHLRRGHLTIGSSPFRSTYLLAVFLPIFQKQYPNIIIELVEDTTLHLETLALNGEIDVSISLLPIDTHNFAYETLFDEQLLLVLPPTHLLCRKYNLLPNQLDNLPAINLNELVQTPFILMNREQKLHNHLLKLCQQAGFSPKIQLETQSMDAAQTLAGAGIGATVLPDTLLKAVQRSPAPCYAALTTHPSRKVIIAWRKNRYLSHAAKAFIQCLQNFYKK